MESAEVHKLDIDNPIIAHLERCQGWLTEALDEELFTWEDVVRRVLAGQAMLWPGKNCAIVTTDEIYPSGERVLQTWLAGGDMAEILQMAPGIEALARLRGCTASLIEGRKGWIKTMKPHGYELWSVTLRKAL